MTLLLQKNDILDEMQKSKTFKITRFLKYFHSNIEFYSTELIQSNSGKVLLYHEEDSDILYFGFFDTSLAYPGTLIQKMVQFTIKNGFKELRGPINIPTTIFDWGITNSNHKQAFIQANFKELYRELVFKCPVFKIDLKLLEQFDFSEYQFINFGEYPIEAYQNEIIELHEKYMPPSAGVSPNKSQIYHDVVNFLNEYGDPSMMLGVLFQNKLVAFGHVLPVPNKPEYLKFQALVIAPKHQGKGLTYLIWRKTAEILNKQYKWGYYPVAADNARSIALAKRFKGEFYQESSIFQYIVNK
jgi:Acetyltransferase (GNAT) family